MKIINILFSDKNGGVEQSFVNYCHLLKNLKHQVLAIVKTGAPYISQIEKLGVEVIEIDNKLGYYDFFAVKEIAQLIKDFKAKLVFAHVGRAMVLSRKALKKSPKVPLIAVNHSNNVKRSIGADVILSVNDVIRSKTIELGQYSEKSFVMPNMIEVDENNLQDHQSKDLSKKFVLGSLGRLSQEKGFPHLIDAVKNLKAQGYKVKLKIAGSGSEERNLRSLLLDLNLDQEVELLEWVEDKAELFSKIDIFCLPSQQETFGMVLLDAMKHKTPIIATDCDGPKSIIEDGVNGILIKKDPEGNLSNEIIAATLKLVNDRELVEKLVENGYKNLLDNYTMHAVEEKIAKIIKDLKRA